MDDGYRDRRGLVIICYALHLIGSIAALPSLVALVINLLKVGDVEPELSAHHRWMIRTFAWTIFWLIVGGLLAVTLLGIFLAMPILLATAIWWIYRHVRGLLNVLDGTPLPA